MHHSQKHEDQLITRFTRGSSAALDALWREHTETLRRKVAAIAGGTLCGAEIDDLVQDTWIRAWRARATFQVGRPFDSWITAIARNVVRSHLRRQPPPDHRIRDAQGSWRGAAPPSPEAELDFRMLCEELDRAMAGLTERRRAALQEELGLQQPASQNDEVSPVARRKRRFDARRAVERELRRPGPS